MVTTAASVDTRVLVLRLLNAIATVLPVNEPINDMGTEPDLIACLCETPLRTKDVSSVGVRSVIDRRCRGANGETKGDAADDNGLFCWPVRHLHARRRGVFITIHKSWR